MLLKLNLQRFASETWVLNNIITDELLQTSISFMANGVNFFGIRVADELGLEISYFTNSNLSLSRTVYTSGWTDQAYRTLLFETAPTGELLTWLQANGTKQATQQTIVKGTYVWNSYLDVRSWLTSSGNVTINANFNSNDTSYSFFQFERADYETYVYYNNTYAYTNASTPQWQNDNYKTIEVTSDTAVDSDFYTWFTANTTKQATEITYTCKWYLDGTLVNTSTFTHEKLTGVDYYALGSVFKVMLSAETLAQYDYGVNLNSETSNASLGTDNVITIEAFKGNIVFNITSNGKTTLATKNTYVPSDIDFNVNVPSGSSLLDITATFKVEDSNYQITSIKSGNKITRPYIDPTISGKSFQGWFDASSGGNKVSFPLSATSDQEIYAQFIDATIATVSGLGSANTSNVTFDVPSDFKFTDGTYTDSNGNVFVKIPKMYRKVNATSNGQITSFSISNVKIDDDYKLYPVFLAEDGVTELDWVGIGQGMNSSTTKLNTSATTSSAKAQITLSQGRTSLTNYYNSNYQLYDWMFHKLWQDLIICKMQTINTNSGSGIQQDQLGIYWGGTGTMVDGFGHVDSYVYLCDKPSKYVDSPTASTDGYFTTSYRIPTSSGEIQKLGYDEMHPFVNLPSAVISNSSYNTYYCDYYGYSSGNHPFYCYVGGTYADYGVFYLRGDSDWTSALGVRLCYRPIGE